MHKTVLLHLIFIFAKVCLGHDENTEDVFLAPFTGKNINLPDERTEMDVNEGSDTFEVHTALNSPTSEEKSIKTKLIEMIEPSATNIHIKNDWNSSEEESRDPFAFEDPKDSIAVTELKPTSDQSSTFTNLEHESREELVSTSTVSTSTIRPSFPIVSKEETNPIRNSEESVSTSTSAEHLDSFSSNESESEPPFDQEKLFGIFEQDGSPVANINDENLFVDSNVEDGPTFPMAQLPEHSEELISEQKHVPSDSKHASHVPIEEISNTTESSEVVDSLEQEPIALPMPSETFKPMEEDLTTTSTNLNMMTSPSSLQMELSTEAEVSSTKLAATQQPPEMSTIVNSTSSVTSPVTLESSTTTEHLTKLKAEPASTSYPTKKIGGRLQKFVKTPLQFRIISVDYMEEFANSESGKYKKLKEQIVPQVSVLLRNLLEENFEGFNLVSLTKGSVIVTGNILTQEPILDAENLASRLESYISSQDSKIGKHDVDSRSITVNGFPSRAYLDRVQSSYPVNKSSGLLVGGIIAVAIFIILSVALLVIMLNNRRSNGNMKLKGSEIPRVETGKVHSPQSVNLTAFEKGGQKVSVPAGSPMITSLTVTGEEREVS